MRNSQSALDRFCERPDAVDMIISDVTMPHLTGDELAMRCLEIRPDLPIILMTGYSDQVTEKSVRQMGIKALLYKPLVGQPFLARVRWILDGTKN